MDSFCPSQQFSKSEHKEFSSGFVLVFVSDVGIT